MIDTDHPQDPDPFLSDQSDQDRQNAIDGVTVPIVFKVTRTYIGIVVFKCS